MPIGGNQKQLSMRGILNIYKPEEFTSHDIVAIVRRLVGIKKVGHTGTLDPMATGVLPVCIGSATRVIEYLDEDRKEYFCTLRLGVETDTCDVWGETIETKEASHLTDEEIKSAVQSFEGEQMQVPPQYAAIKIRGKKLYEYARAGKIIEVPPRPVIFHSIDVENISGSHVSFRVVCSRGTYIRSLCRDIGSSLGVGGTVAALARTASGVFRIEDAVNINRLREMDREEIREHILPMDFPIQAMSEAQLNSREAKDFIDGKQIRFRGDAPKRRYRVYCGEVFVGVAVFDGKNGRLVAEKVLNTGI